MCGAPRHKQSKGGDAMLSALFALSVVLFVGIAVALAVKYRLTRDAGFLWLGAALVAWPLICMALGQAQSAMVARIASERPVGIFPYSLVEQQEMTIGELIAMFAYAETIVQHSLALLAITFLCRTKPQGASPHEPARGRGAAS